MITRRKIGTLVAAALGAVGVGAKAQAASTGNISQEELDARFLASRQALLLPGLYRERERDALDRTLDLRVIGSEYLLLTSYNGYDRQERWVNIPVAALREDWRAAWNKALAEVLPLGKAQRPYQVLAIAMKVTADISVSARDGGVELDSWLDHVTDNVLIKSYYRTQEHRDKKLPGVRLGFAITLRAMEDKSDAELEAEIRSTVQILVRATLNPSAPILPEGASIGYSPAMLDHLEI